MDISAILVLILAVGVRSRFDRVYAPQAMVGGLSVRSPADVGNAGCRSRSVERLCHQRGTAEGDREGRHPGGEELRQVSFPAGPAADSNE